MDFFDIHSHIIPKVDDGSQDDQTTLAMLQRSYDDNVRNIILTPHYNEKRHLTVNVKDHIEHMNKLAKKVADDLNLYYGNEIYFTSNVIRLLQDNKIATLADSKYVLIEFSVMSDYKKIESAVRELLYNGFWPIIAHVERYLCLSNDIDKIESLKNLSAKIQINADSLLNGKFKIKRFIKKLINYSLVDFIASDCHDAVVRPPDVGKCIPYSNKKFGESITEKLLCSNPHCIINNIKN